jgi:hypothetical protein
MAQSKYKQRNDERILFDIQNLITLLSGLSVTQFHSTLSLNDYRNQMSITE